MVRKSIHRAEKDRLERSVDEASRKVAVLERERLNLIAENQALRARAALDERSREEVAVTNERLELLGRFTREINSLNPEKIFEIACTHIPFILGARYASIYVYDERARKLYLKRHTHGRPIEHVVDASTPHASAMASVLADGAVRAFADLDVERHPDREGEAVPRPYRHLYRTRSCIIAPLRAGDQVFGVLNLADPLEDRPFDANRDVALVRDIADLLAIALRNFRLFERVQQEARADPLTKLMSHQAFYDELNREVERTVRYGSPLSVLLIDIDRFKLLNDNHGHFAGDFVLGEVARVLTASVRLVDSTARFGGDEFAILLPSSDVKAALVVAERIQARMTQQRFAFAGHDLEVRLSVGARMLERGKSASQLVHEADEALARARRAGGNRIVAGE